MARWRLIYQRNLLLKLLIIIFIGVLILYLLRDVQLQTPPRQKVALFQDQPLLNLTNFHYLISPDACHSEEEVKALMVITSHSGNVLNRMAWRNGIPTKVKIKT
jgi:hypothetical protein